MEELLKLYQQNELELGNIEKEISLAVADLITKQNEITSKNKELKEQIKNAMEENEVKKYENDFISITYVAPTTRNTVDSAKLKAQFEDVYNQCLKVSNVKSSIRIKIKEIENVENDDQVKKIDLSDKF